VLKLPHNRLKAINYVFRLLLITLLTPSIAPNADRPPKPVDLDLGRIVEIANPNYIASKVNPPDYAQIKKVSDERLAAEAAAQAALAAQRAAEEALERAQKAKVIVNPSPVITTPQASPVQVTATIPLGSGLLDAIARCESSGNPRASNGTHFGLFQFDLPTWQSVGGSGNPMDVSPAEQYARAQTLFSQRGTQPWLASMWCWRK
jgi:hypothetical protein